MAIYRYLSMLRKTFFLILICFIAILSGVSAQSIQGEWEGKLSQKAGGISRQYGFRMYLKQKGNKVDGYSYIFVYGQEELYGKMRLRGSFEGNTFYFTESRITEQEMVGSWEWCFKEGILQLVKSEDKWSLIGPWKGTGSTSDCTPGYIIVSKLDSNSMLRFAPDQRPELLLDREIKQQESIVVSSPRVKLKLWDTDKIDGDSVSLSLNGQWVRENLSLKRRKQKIKLKLDPNRRNFLIMYALNEGSIPPNTAAVSYKTRSGRKTVILTSNLKSCGALQFRVER